METTTQQDKIDDFQVSYWKEERERSLRNKWYAIGRIDLLIISISGGSIYLIFEIIKYLSSKIPPITDYQLIKIAGLFFGSAIIINFLSQIFGQSANRYDAKYCKGKMNRELKKTVSESDITVPQCWANAYSKAVNICNALSIISMSIGLILLSVFTYTTL